MTADPAEPVPVQPDRRTRTALVVRRYECPFSRCGGLGFWTLRGVKRHIERHMDAIHDRLDREATDGR